MCCNSEPNLIKECLNIFYEITQMEVDKDNQLVSVFIPKRLQEKYKE